MSSVQEKVRQHRLPPRWGKKPDASGAEELAAALDWQGEEATVERLRRAGNLRRISRGSIANEPAMLFVGHGRGEAGELLREAALFAYHASIEWGVVTNSVETIVFNSHWVKDGDWFSLPPFDARELDRAQDLLQGLTPDGLATGRMDVIAHSFYEPDEVLAPVDDNLVDCLDWWREEALKHARQAEGIDEQLQLAFAQFFILRAVEDRGLAPRLPSLRSTLTKEGQVDLDGLGSLFRAARKEIQSELFDVAPPADVPTFALAGVIQDLYKPRGVPINDFRYNFAWLGAEVLGRAYERYLSTVLIPSRRPQRQAELFEQPARDVERVSQRRAGGVYYTPDFITRYLSGKCLEEHFASSPTCQPGPPRIADVSCGSGSFLTAAVDCAIRKLRVLDRERNWGRELIKKRCVVGIDIDQRAVTLARLSLWLRLTEEPEPLPLPNLNNIIVQGDSLGPDVWLSLPQSYDVIVGNPPFLPATRVPSRTALSRRFKTAKGRFDYSYLFVETCIDRLAPQGVLGLVVPNRLFRNTDAAAIREYITQEADLLTVTDFGSLEVFGGTASYVGLICAQKRPEVPTKPRETVRVIRIHELPDRFAGSTLRHADRSQGEVKLKFVHAYFARHPRGRYPWVLLSPSGLETRIRLAEAGRPLARIAHVRQGIKTGANDILVLEAEASPSSGICRMVNGLGDTCTIETACLKPVVFGAEIGRYDTVGAGRRYVLYPYEDGEPIPELVLRERFPRAYEYLHAYRDFLIQRSSLAGGGEWYELIRQRKESWLEAMKIVTRDLATEPSFALDDHGGVFLIGGVAIIPEDERNLLPLLGYLNSSVSDWFLTTITPAFRAGFRKFEPSHLMRLPVPEQVISEGPLRDRLRVIARQALDARTARNQKDQAVLEKQINELLKRSLSIDLGE